MANPTRIRWLAPTTYVDGTPYGEADHAGFTLYFLNPDGSPATSVAVPVGWNANGQYEFPISSLGLKQGTYRIAMTTVAKNGLESERSAPATFELKSQPRPPADLAVA